MGEGADKTELVFCNNCVGETQHKIVHFHRGYEKYFPYNELQPQMGGEHRTIDWETLVCQGCRTPCLRKIVFDSETDASHYGLDLRDKTFFPARKERARAKPSWFDDLHRNQKLSKHFILSAHNQIYILIENELPLAALLTCRALLETIVVEHVGQAPRTFEQKLTALHDKELIRKSDIEFMNKHIYDAGSAAMHRGHNPSLDTVTYFLDVIEKLLHSIYIEPIVKKHMTSEVPPRQKKP